MSAHPPTRLDARYGRLPGRRLRARWIGATAIVAGAAAVVAWAAWTGVGGAATDSLDLTTNGFDVHGRSSVTVRWRVSGGSGEALVCGIEAQAGDRSVVGLKAVAVPAGSGDRSGTTTVRTVRLAVTGLLSSCRRA